MPIPEKYLANFEENHYYHVYNHAVYNNILFVRSGNYEYFLRRFDEYLSDWIEVDAWCLMINHFHFLVRVKPINELSEEAKTQLAKFECLHDCISNQFKRFFMAYALAFNKEQNRKGSLFEQQFRRIWVNNETYYTRLVYYIHANPRHHGAMYDFQYYMWSSYGRILNPKPTKLRKEEVLNWFGGEEKYKNFHANGDIDFGDMKDYLID